MPDSSAVEDVLSGLCLGIGLTDSEALTLIALSWEPLGARDVLSVSHGRKQGNPALSKMEYF
ncbi:MAG: hypothetical protein AAF530_14575 [Pseudomonadota bacterium]